MISQQPIPHINTFTRSRELQARMHRAIPGGSHTYAKGDDQYPEFYAPYLTRGEGCHVWDVDGNEFIEYNMGVRAVSLGHGYRPVLEAAYRQMQQGINFVRPTLIELECAEQFLSIITGAEMVKFAKNGSDATTGAVRLARAHTGRDLVAVCADHPFFSTEDWFIGSTPMAAGVPENVRKLTVKFRYNDVEGLRTLFAHHPAKIACVILEPEKEDEPDEAFLRELRALCTRHGAVLILDEMITGFRWHLGGAQAYYGLVPDLSTFGKALGNGFSVSALAGKRELMERGGLHHQGERVFLLSTTHGAEGHALAAAMAVIQVYKEEPVVETLWQQGQRLRTGVTAMIEQLGLQRYFRVRGKSSCLVFQTCDENEQPSQAYRTLFMQEMIRRGVIAPSFVVSYSHTDDDIDTTIECVQSALEVYQRALHDGIEKYLEGRPVKPVFRRLNAG